MNIKKNIHLSFSKWFEIYSILVCAVIAIPLILLAILLQNVSWLFHFLLFACGWLVWTWIEYHAHRFLMHPKSNKWKTSTSQSHQHHHRQPSKLEVTLFYRIVLFVLNCCLFYIAYRLNNFFTLFAGFSWGAAAFCYIHYLLHQRWTRTFMPRHHAFHTYHHCKYTDRCFGVTVTWWDYLFFTAPPKAISLSDRIVDFYYQSSTLKQ
jgi:sterol desaturase/sphingolipid hydroxylase (fatty acid hydroxylase superfamily)